jgi:hypothetical protein
MSVGIDAGIKLSAALRGDLSLHEAPMSTPLQAALARVL